MKILITGASSGIGAELARQYATSENELILLARREDRLYALRKELFEKCKSIEIIVADVTEFKELQRKLQSVTDVDLLILNAGISLGSTMTIATIDEMQNLYNVNVLSNHAILEVLLPKFLEKTKGHIVFISSLASLFSMPTAKIYSSSKRALNAYAEGVRYKYKNYGIYVTLNLPGFIKSELTAKNEFNMPFLLETEDGAKRIIQAIKKKKKVYAFPKRFYYLIKLLSLLPDYFRQKLVNHFI